MFRIPDAMRSGQGENAADQREQKGEHVRKFPDADAVPGEAAFLVMELESFGAGGRWLLECWNQLGAILDQGLAWDALEVFKAIRLLGMCPFDLNSVLGLTAVIQACRMLDPGSLALIDEVWNELIPADLSKFPGWRPPVAPPRTPRRLQELLDIVKRETERLEAINQTHEEREALEQRMALGILAFDQSPEGERMRRYENACVNYMHRIRVEFGTRANAERSR